MEHDRYIQIRASDAVKCVLDDLRKLEDDLPSRSEMIRRLVERAAAASKRGRK